jgi:hypothetical protein
MGLFLSPPCTPAKAGVQIDGRSWTPAFAGVRDDVA